MNLKVDKEKTFYKSINTYSAKDKKISWKARGILFYLMSMPDGWECRVSNITSMSDKDGVDSVRSAMKELVNAGYAVLKNGYVSEDKKTHGKHYIVSDKPKFKFPNFIQNEF